MSSSKSVPLPERHRNEEPAEPLWRLDSTQLLTTPEVVPDEPLESKCVTEIDSEGCCRNIKKDDERYLISPDVVRDVIVGLSDGLTVPFALSAGLSGLNNSRLVITGGLAELFAGAISMGLGGYLASRAEMDHLEYLAKQTHQRTLRSCSGELERQVHTVLGPFGVQERVSRIVTQGLREAELQSRPALVTAPRIRGLGGLMRKVTGAVAGEVQETGITPFLLKVGEGLDEIPTSRQYISAATIGGSYFIGGLIPLIPYFTHLRPLTALGVSAGVTATVLFVFGGFKVYFTGAKGGWSGYLFGAISTMLVGALAAAAAFGLVKALGTAI